MSRTQKPDAADVATPPTENSPPQSTAPPQSALLIAGAMFGLLVLIIVLRALTT